MQDVMKKLRQLSFHGTTAKMLQYLQNSLKTTGLAPLNIQEKHNSKPNKLK